MKEFLISGFGDEIDGDLEVQLDVLRKLGMHYVELRSIDDRNILDFDDDELDSIRRRLDAYGIQVSSVASAIGKIPIEEAVDGQLVKLRRAIQIAKRLSAPFIRMFSFILPAGEEHDRHSEEVVDRWRQFAAIAEGQDVILALENAAGLYADTPERCARVMECSRNGNLRLVFDPAEFIGAGVSPYPETFALLRDHIGYVHVKDARLRTGEHVPAGMGDGHLSDIVRALADSEYAGFLSVEPHLWKFEEVGSFELPEAISTMPQRGPKTFAIAVGALREILDSHGVPSR